MIVINAILSDKNLKSLIVVAPLLGATFAILIDIGFFWSIGPGWFTYFTLTEHIAAALATLPAAIVLVGLFYGGVFFVWWLVHRTAIRFESQSSTKIVPKRWFPSRIKIVLLLFLLADLLFIYWMLKEGDYSGLFQFFGGTFIISVTVIVYLAVSNQMILVFFTLFLCSVSSLTFGFWFGYNIQVNIEGGVCFAFDRPANCSRRKPYFRRAWNSLF